MAAIVRPMVHTEADASDGPLTLREVLIMLITLTVVLTAGALLVMSATSTLA